MKARDVIAQYVYEDVLETAVHPSECAHHGDELLAALAREGLAVVPVEPTEDMILAALGHMVPSAPGDEELIEFQKRDDARVYRAMIAAAETAPETQDE